MYKKLSAFLFIAILHNIVFGQAKDAPLKGYGKASYNAASTGKFMKNWLIAGPVSVSADSLPENTIQEKAFKEDLPAGINVVSGASLVPVRIKQKDLQWKLFSSGENAIALDKVYEGKDFVYAYALAEIKSSKAANVMLGVGSDDGIKIWLNGKLVHENWIPRAANKDDDIIPLKLVKGSNQLLLKVQDMQGGWGFIVRLLDKEALADQLIKAAANGNIDKINSLIEGGADVTLKDTAGVSPVIAAKIVGREDVVQLLLKKGAKDEPVPPVETLFDALYAPIKTKEAPGIAILVARNGKIVYEKGFGYADIKGKQIITPDTKFRIGSVTKQFTASAILKLQEDNLLSVNDKLSKYIPDFPKGEEVTIHHLLTHTSGIHSYTSKPDFIDKVTKTITEDSLIRSFENDPYDFNPGENFMYNNSGYFLLGYIIEKVSGKSYAQYLKQTFFDTLGMKNTGVHYTGIKLENEAHGYGGDNGKYDDAINWDMSWAGGAGALYSTLEDLLKWNEALHSGKVINEASLKAATTPVVLNSGEKSSMNYGYGLIMTKYRGQDIISHGGGLHGFVTQLAYYPKQKLSVVMFSNSMSPEVNFDPNKIAEMVLWNEMDKQTSYAVSAIKPENLQQYSGRYDFINAVMHITAEEGKLFARLTGQGKFEIFPLAPNEFFWKVVDAKIIFEKNEQGEISHGLFTQNGQQINVKKLKEDSVVKIDPVLLDSYTGKYKFVENIVVTISKEKDKLFAQATDQEKLEMFPVSDTGFVVKEINATLDFIKGENGKFNKIKLRMNNTNSDLQRME